VGNGFRNKNFDLSPVLTLQPMLLRKPEINGKGMLRVTGFYLALPPSPRDLIQALASARSRRHQQRYLTVPELSQIQQTE